MSNVTTKPKMSAQYFDILTILQNQPEKAIFVTHNDTKVMTMGFNTSLSDVIVLCAAAAYRGYTELSEEAKKEITPEQVVHNFGVQFHALLSTLGSTTDEINRHNASLPQTGQSRHHNSEAQDITDVPPEAYATTGDNSR